MPRESVRKFYSDLHDKFETYKGVPALSTPGVHERVVEEAKRVMPAGGHVLDVGCGRGALALRLADAGFSVDGCDIFDHCEVKDRINFIHVAAEDAPFTGPYDAVFMVEFLIATESPYQVMRQYAPMIKPGGYLIISTANVDSDRSRAEFFLRGRHDWFGPHNVVGDGAITPFFRFQVEHALEDLDLRLQLTKPILPVEDPPLGVTWAILNLLRSYQRMKGTEPEEGRIVIYVAKKGDAKE